MGRLRDIEERIMRARSREEYDYYSRMYEAESMKITWMSSPDIELRARMQSAAAGVPVGIATSAGSLNILPQFNPKLLLTTRSVTA